MSATNPAGKGQGKGKRRRRRRNGKGQARPTATFATAAEQLLDSQNPVPFADQQGKGGGKSSRQKKRLRNGGAHEGAPAGRAAGDAAAAVRSGSSGETNSETDNLAGADRIDSISAKGLKAGRRRNRRRRKRLAGQESDQANPVAAHAGDQIKPAGVRSADGRKGRQSQKAKVRRDADVGSHPRPAPLPAEASAVVSAEAAPVRIRHSAGAIDPHELYAALDLGTNNCRLLIARPEERGFRVVDAYSRIVRLGEGIGANRRLGNDAMDRAVDALANCHRKLAERGVMRSRLIATEACRAAENGVEFIDRVRRETGLALEIVDRETEARLAVAGCVSLVDPNAEGVLLFDIGGGSSEIVWLDLRNRCGARGYALTRFIRSWISLPVGVVNLSERHGGVHVTPQVFEEMVQDVAGHLQHFNLADDLSRAIAEGEVHMLGTSGTVTTLAGVHLGLRRYDRRRVDGTWLTDDQVSSMIDQLRDMSYEERVENPCIGADRADLVLAGCAILEAIRRRWTCSKLRVADRGLREGILTEMMAADGVWNRKTGRSRRAGSRNRGRQ
nr:Ppx/GppA phosphatase family protein [Roseibium sediminis]